MYLIRNIKIKINKASTDPLDILEPNSAILSCWNLLSAGSGMLHTQEDLVTNAPVRRKRACCPALLHLQHMWAVCRTEEAESESGPTVLACKGLPFLCLPWTCHYTPGYKGRGAFFARKSHILGHWVGTHLPLEDFVGVSLRENGFSKEASGSVT